MSRQPQLPPRCPIPKTNSPNYESLSSITSKDENLYLRHHKSVSQSFGIEEQPAWLDDLLGDWEPDFESKSHRRAASDSGTVLNGLPSLNMEKDDKKECPRDAPTLESACIYGPNSPRSKEKSPIQESAIVSALSEFASHGPMPYANKNLFVSGFTQVDSFQDAAGEVNKEAKPFKRHAAQRSRVRKLQYIAQLERSVENFQNIVSELGIRVDALVKQRVYLSLENKQLKQRLGRLQQEKFLMDRQYQCMRNEVEVLKNGVAFSRNGSKARTLYRSSSAGDAEKLQMWNMIDMGKLQIN